MNYKKLAGIVVVLHLPLMALRPVFFKGTVGVTGVVSALHVVSLYNDRTYDVEHASEHSINCKSSKRIKDTAFGVCIAAGVTSLVTCALHKKLPTQRLAEGNRRFTEVKKYPLFRKYSRPIDFFNQLEKHQLRQPFPYLKTFYDLLDKEAELSTVDELIKNAEDDFAKDDNRKGKAECQQLKSAVAATKKQIELLLYKVKKRPDFGERQERHRRVEAAELYVEGAQKIADNTRALQRHQLYVQ